MVKFNTSAIVLTLAIFLLPTQPFAQAQSDGYISGASQLRGKKILLIAGVPEKDHSNDDPLVKKHLEQQGYVVTMGTEDDDASKAVGQGSSSSSPPQPIHVRSQVNMPGAQFPSSPGTPSIIPT